MVKNILLLGLLWASVLQAQQSAQLASSEIIQGLKKLNTVGSVLYVAAHPDDENTRLLSYFAKEMNLRTGYLSITRGDGGQNLVGKEQGDLLGLIRTQELLAARRIDGAEQFFTRANDFGYSKSPEETLKFWNHDSVLSDVVRVIRQFQPDVIICRFPTTGEGGHGHHTASAILAIEAFDAAADAKRFPEQLKELSVWTTKRLFWNTFNFGGTNTTSADQVQVDVGVFNPLLGKSYGEIAAESRSMHKSQGFGAAKTRGKMLEYFKQLKGDSVRNLFEGIDRSWNRLPGGNDIGKLIDKSIANFNAQTPEKSIPELVSIYKLIQGLPAYKSETATWKQQKIKETESLLLACSGLWMEASPLDYTGIPGQEIEITAQVVNRNSNLVKLNSIYFPWGIDTVVHSELKTNEQLSFKKMVRIPAAAPFSNPYWLNEKHAVGMFRVSNASVIGQPENDFAAEVLFEVEIGGLILKVSTGLSYKYTDPVRGEVYRPFEILPPVTVNPSEKVLMFGELSPKTISFTVKANTANVSGVLELKVSEGWAIEMKNKTFALKEKGDEALLEATLHLVSAKGEGKLNASVRVPGGDVAGFYSKSITRVEYDHIPYQFVLQDAEVRLLQTDIKKAGIHIGYIPGAGDDIPSSIKHIGYIVTTLTDEMLSSENLSVYDAIVTGIRAYNTNPRLHSLHSKLMNYVNQGGNLIVQYNTNNRNGPLKTDVGPYPFTISRDRVTDETAEVRMVNSAHPALNFPNKISPADFEGWIQERGIYFAGERDSLYQPVLAMNDSGEKALDGSIITAKYGKGNFVYTGIAFFRQLPAGVPGAYRLFVNLLSLPRHD